MKVKKLIQQIWAQLTVPPVGRMKTLDFTNPNKAKL